MHLACDSYSRGPWRSKQKHPWSLKNPVKENLHLYLPFIHDPSHSPPCNYWWRCKKKRREKKKKQKEKKKEKHSVFQVRVSQETFFICRDFSLILYLGDGPHLLDWSPDSLWCWVKRYPEILFWLPVTSHHFILVWHLSFCVSPKK